MEFGKCRLILKRVSECEARGVIYIITVVLAHGCYIRQSEVLN